MQHFTLDSTTDLTRYDYLWRLSPDRWAWEFLRRSPEFRRDAALRQEHEISAIPGPCLLNARLLRPRSSQALADRWGLALMADPARNGYDADVVWSREAFPDQIEIYCITRAPHQKCEIWEHVTTVSSSYTHVTDFAGREYLLVRCNGSVVQNRCSGVSMLGLEPVRMKLMISDMQSFSRRIKLLQAAFAVYDEKPGRKAAKWSKTTQVLRDGLIALDCLELGGTRRDIAVALYGLERVQEEWGGPSMKHNIRYLVNKAERLRDGAYLSDLLCADPFFP